MNSTMLRAFCLAAVMLPAGAPILAQLASAQSVSPRALLRESVTAMTVSLHQVHMVGVESGEGTAKLRLQIRYSGDCLMKSHQIRSRWHLWGMRPSGAALKPDNRYFVVIGSLLRHSGMVWERDALGANRWMRLGSTTSFPDILYLCPAADFLASQIPSAPQSNLIRLGSVRIAGSSTWHLRGIVAPGKGIGSTVRRTDFYIDQTTHYLVRLENDVRMTGSLPSVSRVTLSRFNTALTILPPG